MRVVPPTASEAVAVRHGAIAEATAEARRASLPNDAVIIDCALTEFASCLTTP